MTNYIKDIKIGKWFSACIIRYYSVIHSINYKLHVQHALVVVCFEPS